MPGIDGIVTHVADERTVLSQYRHKVETKYGEREEPGSNLELIPPLIGNPTPKPSKLAEIVHLHGPNARLNVDSIDNSSNVVTNLKERVFVELRGRASSIVDGNARVEILARIDALESTHGTGEFILAY